MENKEKLEALKAVKDDQSPDGTNSLAVSSQFAQADMAQQDMKAIIAENEWMKQKLTCKICWDKTVCIVFLPCGHLISCEDCASELIKCPYCKIFLNGKVKISRGSI